MEKTIKAFGVTTWLVALGLIMTSNGKAAEQASQPQTSTAASVVSSNITAHVQSTFVRVILPMSEAQPLIERYTGHLNGRVAYDFSWPAINSRIIGLESPQGNISAQFTDHPEAYDQWRKDTKLMFVVDDVSAVLEAAERDGLKIVQKLGRTPVAMQGRFEIVPGFVVELIAWLPPSERSSQ